MSRNEDSSNKPSKMGPHGLGDPDDKSLSKNERNLLIPQIRRRIVKEEKCPNEIKEYEECVCSIGLMMAGIKCKDLKVKMSDCLEFWNDCDELQKRARREYLEERAEYRRSGICSDNRKFMDEYLAAKKNGENLTT
ncbi:COX assembly mitochondrial protein homolog [Planococcus citri]|uniref:COX assembly mitochondrial protein homolog n=1 Tax=Planococcus citri TaxID=170843 RepID=UPI0031F8BECE